MARWKTLLLAGALGCWPALGFAQGNLPVPPAAPGGDPGVPALPPGANTSAVSVSGSMVTPTATNRSARVSLSDMNARGNVAGVPDVSGMPRPEAGMMYTGMPMQQQGMEVQGSFMPAGANNFCASCPVGVEPCGTVIHAKGPSGFVLDGGVSWLKTRRGEPSALYRTLVTTDVGDVVVSQQEDFTQHTGFGWYLGGGYLTADGWFGMITYRRYQDTLHNDRVTNDGTDPNFSIEYIGPGPLGSGAGGGDVPAGGFLDRFFDIKWSTIDLMGGTVISPARCVDVTFAAGARITKLEQNYDAFINRGDGSANGQLLYSRLQGVGPRVGMETRVYPVQPLTLYAKGYTSLLFTDRQEESTTVFQAADGTVTGNFARFNREEIIPMLELSVGADVSLWGGRVIIGGGYEFNYLFEGGSTYTEQSTNPRSARHVNLAIDGFNIHATLLW